LTPLVAWLGAATASPARAAIERASLRLASAHTGELALLLDHADPSVVRGAVRIAAQLATPAAVPGLSRIMRNSETSLRVDAVSALADIGSPGALQALERGTDDTEREVRVTTYRAIGARRHAGALSRLSQALKRKEVRTADLGEKMALFEAYGTLCGDTGVPVLDGMLNARGLLGAKESPELRACAARALGLVGTPAAQGALERAQDTKDLVVRSAVARALRGST
jgi:HEAT repeat protein